MPSERPKKYKKIKGWARQVIYNPMEFTFLVDGDGGSIKNLREYGYTPAILMVEVKK